MKFTNNQFIAFGVFLIGSISVILLYNKLDNPLKNIVNLFTLYGTFLSLFGIGLAYLQIRSIKETSEETQAAVNNSLIRINQVLSISEISRASKVIQEIQTSILHTKTELALLRMKDLKQMLIQVKYNSDLSEYTNNGDYNQNITDLAIDINNINDSLLGKKNGINFSKINQNLEKLATILSEFENKLKFEKNG